RHGLLLRLGVRVPGGPDAPHPVYGAQLQDRAVPGQDPEAQYDIQWTPVAGTHGDGEAFTLLRPEFSLRHPAHGPVGEVVLGGRTAPHLVGLGLLEAIPDELLRQRVDPDDRDGDGISGRVHELADGRVGRFGWKATQPTVREQVAGAFVHDMGITSRLHPREPLSSVQAAVVAVASGGSPEIDDAKLDRIVFYMRTLAVPAPRGEDREEVRAGAAAFAAFGCAACHVPEWTTATEAWHLAAAGVRIRPFTDLLLHDLGPELADGKRDGDARPAEWRTAPLWGLGLVPVVNGHERLLHDGRARGPAEAILWHGGEASAARERFRLAPKAERAALVAFLRSL
ncbi:MAG: thiol oxidoreductase, partial [Planctomycetes bacterium]|nr:thiol oxidoreductase [Planctomycetota bacterium]